MLLFGGRIRAEDFYENTCIVYIKSFGILLFLLSAENCRDEVGLYFLEFLAACYFLYSDARCFCRATARASRTTTLWN
jgi:hypothetical protein